VGNNVRTSDDKLLQIDTRKILGAKVLLILVVKRIHTFMRIYCRSACKRADDDLLPRKEGGHGKQSPAALWRAFSSLAALNMMTRASTADCTGITESISKRYFRPCLSCEFQCTLPCRWIAIYLFSHVRVARRQPHVVVLPEAAQGKQRAQDVRAGEGADRIGSRPPREQEARGENGRVSRRGSKGAPLLEKEIIGCFSQGAPLVIHHVRYKVDYDQGCVCVRVRAQHQVLEGPNDRRVPATCVRDSPPKKTV
jgi:hypothetical protein